MARLVKVRMLFFAKLFALAFGLLGFLAGVLYAVLGALHDLLVAQSLNLGTALAFLAMAGMPILFASVGGLLGLIVAPMYNLAAPVIGGIEVELAE